MRVIILSFGEQVIDRQTIVPRPRSWIPLVVIGFVMSATACGARDAQVSVFERRTPLLTWVGEFTRPAGTEYPQLSDSAKFGSISGLAPDERSQRWVAAIDDREDARLAWLTVSYDERGVRVTPLELMLLRPGAGVPDRIAREADLEAIVSLRDGTFLVAEEGHLRNGQVWQPALLRVDRDGVVTSVIDFPKEFQITGDNKSGLRDNQGIESLAVMPSGRVIAGLEQPLLQDGAITFERGAAGKLLEFEPAGSTFRAAKQWRYMISPTPRVEGYDEVCSDGENGLSDLLALGETRLIAMERACLRDPKGDRVVNTVQLFIVDLVGNEARKRELLDFNELADRLSPALSRLENFEALTFGPIINGVPTLLIASDDNFRKTQKTAFILIGMR
jgi:hypothetical protein